MKNQLFAIAAAALVVAGCSKTEVVKVAENRAIGFSSFVGNPTKTAVTTDSIDQFNVFAGITGQDNPLTATFDDVAVTGGKGKWSYTDNGEALRYWSPSVTYTFQAYSGTNANDGKVTPTADGIKIDGYIADGEEDLLASDVLTITTDNKGVPSGTGVASDGKVNFTFRHLLSMVKFTFTTTIGNVNITVSDIKVTNLPNTGNYTPAAKNTGSWAATGAGEYTFTGGSFASSAKLESGEQIVLPQTLVRNAVDVEFTVTVKGAMSLTAKHNVKLPVSTWQPGLRYNYNVELTDQNITPDPLNPIVFGDPTVDPWDNYTSGGDIEL